MKIIFASGNTHKLEEIRRCIPYGYEVEPLNHKEFSSALVETGNTLRHNALQKALYVYRRIHGCCLADDSGLEIEALNGRPGVYSARYAGPGCSDADNIARVLKEMESMENRRAVFRTVIALILNDVTLFFEGTVKGTITQAPAGTNGFGYDPIFMPDGYDKTFAQMTAEEKNSISHRSLACRQLSRFLFAYSVA
jgi:XTP/dITP diphosphohydrolase